MSEMTHKKRIFEHAVNFYANKYYIFVFFLQGVRILICINIIVNLAE